MRQSRSILKGSEPMTMRSHTSSIMPATVSGWNGTEYTSPMPSTPLSVISFTNTKYWPPKCGGGLPTTKVFTSVIFMRVLSPNSPSPRTGRQLEPNGHQCQAECALAEQCQGIAVGILEVRQ